jgi:hypothetical protein
VRPRALRRRRRRGDDDQYTTGVTTVGSRCAVVAALVCVLVMVALPAAPAAAHPAGVQAATDYRTLANGISPAVPGVRVRFIDHGSRLELSNDAGRTIDVLGYSGEPFLQVRHDGVWYNTRSPSLYVDVSRSEAKARADAAATPEWDHVSTSRVARWHDHRAVWHGNPPPIVAAHPDRPVHILDWAVPVRDGSVDARITGTLDWLPPPSGPLWWVAILAAATAIAALGLLPVDRNRRVAGAALGTLVAAGLVTGGSAIGYALTMAGHSATPGIRGFATEAVGQVLALLTGAGVLGAVIWALSRRASADFFLVLSGLCAALMAGIDNAPVFHHAVTPVPGDGRWARLAVAAVIAGGVGLMIAGGLRMRREIQGVAGAREPRAPGDVNPRA